MKPLKEKDQIKEGVYYSEPTPNQDCCEKCHDVTFEKTYPAHTAYHACLNRECECHKKDQTSEEYKEVAAPMGLSEWRKHGITYGYWAYFKQEVIQELTK